MHKPCKIVKLHAAHQRATELGFLRLADAAARGEIIGGGYTVIDVTGRTREGLLGMAQVNTTLAHYGASRLAGLLLWPEELHTVNE